MEKYLYFLVLERLRLQFDFLENIGLSRINIIILQANNVQFNFLETNMITHSSLRTIIVNSMIPKLIHQGYI